MVQTHTSRWGLPLMVAVLALLAPRLATAADQLDRQAAALARAFSYDHKLKDRAGDTVSIAVLFRSGDSNSEQMANEWLTGLKPFEGARVQGLPFKAMKLAYDSAQLKSLIDSRGIDILLVCEGLSGELATVRELARSRKLLTVGGKQEFVESGLSLGVFSVGGRLQILVNLKAAPEEGVSFSSDLLRLAKVLK